MSDSPVTSGSITPGSITPDVDAIDAPPPAPVKSFVAHAKLISGLTLVSRLLGLARESVSAHYFGAGLVSSAFATAFAIPNLFRKLFGEGALSAAFIPLYAQAIKHHHEDDARDFASASVNLLSLALLAITIVGEICLVAAIYLWPGLRPDWALTLKLTAIMLPYVLLICGTAFLSSILQVHHRFGAPAAAPILLNVVHIIAIVLGARLLHLSAHEKNESLAAVLQTKLAYWLAFFVIVAGVGQLMMLWPSLKRIGFRLSWTKRLWTAQVKRMLMLSLPVAIGAGVLQLSVLMDKGISMALAQYPSTLQGGELVRQHEFFGHVVRLPMELGATARLTWAQFLYQFPLGVFAIALATAIFPGLSAQALDKDRAQFRAVLRQGIEATMFEGLAASAGLILVRYSCIRLLFQHGSITSHDVDLIAQSVMWYATAIWAFSLLQIVNRAFYALHDTTTPLVMSIVNILINLLVEVPLIFTSMGEAGMAVGTSVSFAIQAIVMLWILNRRIGGLGLAQVAPGIAKMFIAMLLMIAACLGVSKLPFYPRGTTRIDSAIQLFAVMIVGATVYCGACSLMGVEVLNQILPKRLRRKSRASSPRTRGEVG